MSRNLKETLNALPALYPPSTMCMLTLYLYLYLYPHEFPEAYALDSIMRTRYGIV